MSVSITALCGSLRAASFNRRLLQAVVDQAPAATDIRVFGIEGIPVYNQDDEDRDGVPAPVEAIKQSLAASDGLLIATPEYNNGIPGGLKNAIDWMTRPHSDLARVFHGKAVAIIGASPGPRGTVLAQTAWLPILRMLAMRPFYEKVVYAGGAGGLFDDSGNLSDEAMSKRVGQFIEGFSAFAAKQNQA